MERTSKDSRPVDLRNIQAKGEFPRSRGQGNGNSVGGGGWKSIRHGSQLPAEHQVGTVSRNMWQMMHRDTDGRRAIAGAVSAKK